MKSKEEKGKKTLNTMEDRQRHLSSDRSLRALFFSGGAAADRSAGLLCFTSL